MHHGKGKHKSKANKKLNTIKTNTNPLKTTKNLDNRNLTQISLETMLPWEPLVVGVVSLQSNTCACDFSTHSTEKMFLTWCLKCGIYLLSYIFNYPMNM